MRLDRPILLIEDDRVEVLTVERAFRDLGINGRLQHAANGEEALRLLRSQAERPSFILLDLNMPIMNGIEFLKEAKRDPALRAIPVIVLTTSKADADKCESFKSGAAGYMIKPMSYPPFVDMIRLITTYWSTSETPNARACEEGA